MLEADIEPFTVPARLIGAVAFPAQTFAVGAVYVQGVGHRVGTWDGLEMRAMSNSAARRLAKELRDEADDATELIPISKAIEAVAVQLDLSAQGAGHG